MKEFESRKSWSCSGYIITISNHPASWGIVYEDMDIELCFHVVDRERDLDKECRSIIDCQKIGYTIKDRVDKQQNLKLLRIQYW